MHTKTDHTSEVEKRIKAIRTRSRDYCSFFKEREGALVIMKECWYCRYASFDLEKNLVEQGFCVFRKP